jgi:hypothetical protein
MKKFTLFILLISLSNLTMSQNKEIVQTAKAKDAVAAIKVDTVKAWYLDGIASLNFSQASFSNWSSGGQNSLGLNSFISLKANYKKGKHSWGNTVDLGYGFNILGKMSNAEFTKTNDKLELTSAYGYSLSKDNKWMLTVLMNFRTQFSAGYNYPDDSTVISNFMAPGYLLLGIGATYAPAKWFYLYLSPASGRATFVLDKKLSDSGAFGVARGKKMFAEFGPYIRADMNKDLSKTINLATTLELFTNYFKDFGNIDVNWSLLLTMKVNKWLAASIATQLIYDNNVKIKTAPTDEAIPHTQFKELFGLGLTYKLRQK